MSESTSQPTPRTGLLGRMSLWLIIVAAAALVAALILGILVAEPVRRTVAQFVVADPHDHESEGGAFYTCGMHPWVLLPNPGDCPICHMDLVPVDPSKFTSEVSIDPVVVQNMGVRVEPVVQGPLVKTIRTVGTIDYDEALVRDVNTKIGGWIEEIFADSVGQRVEAGDPLFTVYSPQLYQAQEEYLSAWRNRDVVGGEALLEAARTRLDFFDVTDQQVRDLQQRGEPTKTLTVRSPHAGYVIDKHANAGMKIDPGMRVYRIAGLSDVWVMVTIYEYQLPYVAQGQQAVMTLPYIPGQTFEGEVTYIYPYLNERTREAKVRLEFDNEQRLLKPGMFANVQLQSTLAEKRTLAPRSAIIDTGERQVAFVSLGEGRFEPRELTLGVETADGMVEVREGLEPGDMVVTSGQFLIDSEAKIRESLAKMIRGTSPITPTPSAVMGEPSLKTMPEAMAEALGAALSQYLVIGDRLASDSVQQLASPATALATALEQATRAEVPGNPHFWHEIEAPGKARAAALRLAEAETLEEARLAFADLSVAMASLFEATGVPPQVDQEMQVLHCPMYREGQGGSTWIQPAGDVRNPFFGASMLRCFDRRQALPRSSAAGGSAAPSPHGGIVESYLKMHVALTQDDVAAAKASARALADVDDPTIAEPAGRAAAADDLDTIREQFQSVTQALIAKAPDLPDAAGPLYQAYCPMVGRTWVQAGEAIRNPYAPYMLECGEIQKTLVEQPN